MDVKVFDKSKLPSRYTSVGPPMRRDVAQRLDCKIASNRDPTLRSH